MYMLGFLHVRTKLKLSLINTFLFSYVDQILILENWLLCPEMIVLEFLEMERQPNLSLDIQVKL